MRTRRLGRTLELAPNEWLPSYVDRLAHLYQAPRVELYDALGLASSSPWGLRGYGIVLEQDRLAVLTEASGLTGDTVTDALLLRYDGVLADFGPWRRHGLRGVKTLRGWLYWYGCHICPRCLAESHGAWDVAWKTPWGFVCLQHQLLLVHACPGCGRRIASWRNTRSDHGTPAALDIPQPGTCTNTVGAGSHSRDCHTDLRVVVTRELRHEPAILEAQRLLNQALAGDPPLILATKHASGPFFAELTELARLLVTYGDPAAMRAPGFATAALSAYQREQLAAGRRERPRAAPTDPAVIAAVAPACLSVLLAETDTSALERLRSLLTPPETWGVSYHALLNVQSLKGARTTARLLRHVLHGFGAGEALKLRRRVEPRAAAAAAGGGD